MQLGIPLFYSRLVTSGPGRVPGGNPGGLVGATGRNGIPSRAMGDFEGEGTPSKSFNFVTSQVFIETMCGRPVRIDTVVTVEVVGHRLLAWSRVSLLAVARGK